MIFDELFESNNKPVYQLDEGVMDRLKNIYMGLVYDTPMGTPDSELINQWQQAIKNELGQDIDWETLYKLQQNFRERGRTMAQRGDVRDWHREMGMTEQGVREHDGRDDEPEEIDDDGMTMADRARRDGRGGDDEPETAAQRRKRSLQATRDFNRGRRADSMREGVQEGIGKKIKRAWQGWSDEEGEKPKDIVNRARAMDIDTAKDLRGTLDDVPTHSPAGLQRRALDRKLKGVQEGVNAKQIKRDLDSGMSYDAVIGKHANKRMTNTDEIRRVIQQHAWEKRMKRPKEQGVAEGAKWRSNPDAHDINDDGDIYPKTRDMFAYDPLSRRQSTAGDARTARGKKSALKTSLKMAQGRHGPKGQLPEEQGVSEGLPSHIKKSDVPPAMRSKLTMRDVEAERPKGAYRYRVGDKQFMDLAAAQSFARGTGETVKPIREVKKKLSERGAERSARIDRILKMLRARNPQAQDDLEALLLNYRADQAHDQQEIDRLDAENDQEEADIANLQQIVRRRMAEQAALTKFRTREHPAFRAFAESWYRAHGGEIQS